MSGPAPWALGLLVSVGLAAGLPACSKGAPPSADVPATVAPAAPSVVPADHLAPGELVEGKDVAFGVVLPRGLAVEERFVDVVHASGPMSVHSLVAYFRPRLTGGAFREGERSATFEHVSAPGATADTDLTLHVAVGPGKTVVDISATPVHHAPELGAMSDEERWKQQGLSPNGKVLDPQHMH